MLAVFLLLPFDIIFQPKFPRIASLSGATSGFRFFPFWCPCTQKKDSEQTFFRLCAFFPPLNANYSSLHSVVTLVLEVSCSIRTFTSLRTHFFPPRPFLLSNLPFPNARTPFLGSAVFFYPCSGTASFSSPNLPHSHSFYGQNLGSFFPRASCPISPQRELHK